MRISDWSSDVCSSDLRDVVHCLGDVIDRGDRHLPARKPEQRQPLGHRVADLLYRLEEVIRAVDLVHLAGFRRTHHRTRPVDAKRHRRFVTNDLLGLVLGTEIRMAEALAFIEHVFAERSEEHTSELQSLMRISYAVFCLKKKKKTHLKR